MDDFFQIVAPHDVMVRLVQFLEVTSPDFIFPIFCCNRNLYEGRSYVLLQLKGLEGKMNIIQSY
jgi:hypothetical protein